MIKSFTGSRQEVTVSKFKNITSKHGTITTKQWKQFIMIHISFPSFMMISHNRLSLGHKRLANSEKHFQQEELFSKKEF